MEASFSRTRGPFRALGGMRMQKLDGCFTLVGSAIQAVLLLLLLLPKAIIVLSTGSLST